MKKLLSVIFISAATAGIVSAQTPKSAPKGEPRVFTWSSEDSGGYLGVQTEEVSKENFSKFGLRDVRGVAIGKVVDGSPAAAAGLQNGDVIVKVNGDEITSSRKLTRLIGEISPDHSAKVTVLRNGSERDVTVTLGKRPMPQFADGNFNFSFPKGFEGFDPKDMPELKDLPRVPSLMGRVPEGPEAPQPFVFAFGDRRQIGVGLTALTKQLGDHFGVESGAMVNNVREDSPAAKAGLKAGDIILEVEGKTVKGEMDVIRAIAEKKEGDISLTFIRDKNRQTIRVTPEEVKGSNNFFEFQRPPSAPNAPAAPGVYRMMVPRAPGARAIPAMPLNQMMIPGRVI